jgi:hypothetical protein
VQITFYHATDRDDAGMPKPFFMYLILESPAPWLGPNAKLAAIQCISASVAPLPNSRFFTSIEDPPGRATADAVAALRALPALQGLKAV